MDNETVYVNPSNSTYGDDDDSHTILIQKMKSQDFATEEHFSQWLRRKNSTSSTSSDQTSTPEISTTLFGDLCQTQLALWTFTLSVVLTNLWQVKRVRISNLFCAWVAVSVAACLSGVLAFLVVAAHLFNRKGFLSDYSKRRSTSNDESSAGWMSPRLHRSLSISSQVSGGDVRSRHSSGLSSPVYKNQPVFWEKKVYTEKNYVGSVSSSR